MTGECQYCENGASWTWFDGMASSGRYCDEHAHERLDAESNDDLPGYTDAITTEASATTTGRGTMLVPGGGVQPLDSRLPVIRAKEAFDEYNEGGESA